MARSLQRVPDGTDTPVHHVRRGDDVAAGRGLDQSLADQLIDRGVIGDAVAVQHAVMTVRGEGIQRHVADHADIGGGILDGLDRIGNQAVRVEGLRAGVVFFGRIDMREDRHGRNAERFGLFGRLRQCENG